MKEKYTFNEKDYEYDNSTKKELPVWKGPKYLESKEKALETIKSKKYDLVESDFWILMNKTSKGDKMAYTGLIISHNGCLKINDKLEDKMKFKPSCVSENQNGYEESLIYTYSNNEQGIYEVGEISKSNYRQANGRYPYAMAYKRLFDRVVLKNSKLAYAGIYSDSEAEEFTGKVEEKTPTKKTEKLNFVDQMEADGEMINIGQQQNIEMAIEKKIIKLEEMLDFFKVKELSELTFKQAFEIEAIITKRMKKISKEKEEVF